MPAPDPMNLIIAKARADSDQQIAFYQEHLKGLISAWRNHMGKFDRDALIQNYVKVLMEDTDQTREDLCYKIVVAVDMMARAK